MPGIHHFNCLHCYKYSLFSSGKWQHEHSSCPTLVILLLCIDLNPLFSSGGGNTSITGCPTLIILLLCIDLNSLFSSGSGNTSTTVAQHSSFNFCALILILSLFRKWQYKQERMPNGAATPNPLLALDNASNAPNRTLDHCVVVQRFQRVNSPTQLDEPAHFLPLILFPKLHKHEGHHHRCAV